MNNHFQFVTRRILAWTTIAAFALSMVFLIIWGSITKATELVTLGAGSLTAAGAGVLGYYFGKKVEEE